MTDEDTGSVGDRIKDKISRLNSKELSWEATSAVDRAPA